MTTAPTLSRRAAMAAAFSALLLLAPLHQAEAAGRGIGRTTTAGTKKADPTPTASSAPREKVVRDHRGTKRPYRGRPICAGWGC